MKKEVSKLLNGSTTLFVEAVQKALDKRAEELVLRESHDGKYFSFDGKAKAIGEFHEKDHGHWFQYAHHNDEWAHKHGLPHKIKVGGNGAGGDQGYRYGHVKGTRAHVAVDENDDGTPKMETWHFKKHNKYANEEIENIEENIYSNDGYKLVHAHVHLKDGQKRKFRTGGYSKEGIQKKIEKIYGDNLHKVTKIVPIKEEVEQLHENRLAHRVANAIDNTIGTVHDKVIDGINSGIDKYEHHSNRRFAKKLINHQYTQTNVHSRGGAPTDNKTTINGEEHHWTYAKRDENKKKYVVASKHDATHIVHRGRGVIPIHGLKEDVEQLDELSRGVVGRYMKAAMQNKDQLHQDIDSARDRKDEIDKARINSYERDSTKRFFDKKIAGNKTKLIKRTKGMNNAIKRLTKEE